jgi:glycosyltransferase involved in cell wall biosynthesis
LAGRRPTAAFCLLATTVRVLITVPWGERLGGAETMLWTFLRHVDRRRVEPTVAFLQSGPYVREVETLGIRTVVLEAGRLREPVRFVRTVARFARLVDAERCDLVLNWSPKTHLYCGLGAALAGMSGRTLWWQHGVPAGDWLDRLATVIPARAVGVSSQASASAQSRLQPRLSTFTVYPGIDLQPPSPAAELTALRSNLGLPTEAFIVGVAGRLQPAKRQHLLVQAVSRLRARGRAVHGLVVGGDAYGLSPDYADSLPRLAAELGVAEHVTFVGQVDDTGPYMELMDVVVNTSVVEAFGIVLLEAMALAKPVVAFASTGPLEIVQPGVSGLLLPEDGGTEALVATLDRLLDDPGLCRRLGMGARRRFSERFTARRMTESLTQALERWRHG